MLMNKVGHALLIHKPEVVFLHLIYVLFENVINLYKGVILIPIDLTLKSGIIY